MLYGYARVSTDRQEHSAGAQQERLKDYATRAGLELADLYVDEDVTGSIPLRRRPQGLKLWDTVKRGDIVVLTKLDRGFRSMSDAAHTLKILNEIGVGLVILDLPLDLNTPEGRLMFHQFAAFSQFERERIGQRTREIVGHLAKSGRPYSSTRPWGWLRKKNEFVPCEDERALAKRVAGMRAAGQSYSKIAFALACEGIRKPTCQKKASGYYHVPDVIGLFRAAAAGFPRLPQGFWLRSGIEQRLHAEKSGGRQL